MAIFFTHLTYWHWLGLGLILLILEVLISSGGFLLWIGLASLVTAVITLISASLLWSIQLLIFAVAGIVLVTSWWSYLQRNPSPSDQPSLNRRSEHYIGRIFTLETAIENGRGSIRVDDSTWRVMGDELPQGTRVQVIAAEGVILRVVPVEAKDKEAANLP